MISIQKTYNIISIARIIGIHPNTVRLYEQWGLITPPARKENGYRVFTDLHILQFKLARVALQIEVLQNGLRKKVIDIIKVTANGNIDSALSLTKEYVSMIESEIANAKDAVNIVKGLIHKTKSGDTSLLTRKQTSNKLEITIDTLRNWEMNGLIKVKRRENGYRVYNYEDLQRLKIIRTLKCANYSLSAILRMLNILDKDVTADIDEILNKPLEDEDIISACDKLVVSLNNAKSNAFQMENILLEIKDKYTNPPL